ncbi:hypothetical protein GOV09_03805 [Candidatus Woesearchaeota archaeon]|nr:hypothetical protein [Candidatus Woesearchaeota archaeon]
MENEDQSTLPFNLDNLLYVLRADIPIVLMSFAAVANGDDFCLAHVIRDINSNLSKGQRLPSKVMARAAEWLTQQGILGRTSNKNRTKGQNTHYRLNPEYQTFGLAAQGLLYTIARTEIPMNKLVGQYYPHTLEGSKGLQSWWAAMHKIHEARPMHSSDLNECQYLTLTDLLDLPDLPMRDALHERVKQLAEYGWAHLVVNPSEIGTFTHALMKRLDTKGAHNVNTPLGKMRRYAENSGIISNEGVSPKLYGRSAICRDMERYGTTQRSATVIIDRLRQHGAYQKVHPPRTLELQSTPMGVRVFSAFDDQITNMLLVYDKRGAVPDFQTPLLRFGIDRAAAIAIHNYTESRNIKGS